LLLLPRYASVATEPALTAAIADPDLRLAALRALTPSASQATTLLAMASRLRDPVRAVRIEAARALAGTDLLSLTPALQTALVNGTKELVAAEPVDADRPEAPPNLGLLDSRRRDTAAAEAEYRMALHLDPGFVPANSAGSSEWCEPSIQRSLLCSSNRNRGKLPGSSSERL
jgi:hypothetical protein